MGSQQAPEYYDAIWAQPYYRQPPDTLRWYSLWAATSKLVAGIGCERIIDLGCGMGHLASVLSAAGVLAARQYVGYDFSPEAVRLAREAGIENCQFEVADLLEFDFNVTAGPCDRIVYIANEFFEHVEFDLALIGRLRPAQMLIFSVPTFDDPGHVRYFKDASDIRSRYGRVLELDSVDKVDDHRFLAVGMVPA